jgi:hypothetical protein
MIYYLTYLKDTIGNNYIGIQIPNGTVTPFLNELKSIIGEDDFKTYTENQQKRDHGDYHITVINVMEYNALSKSMGIDKFINSLDPIFKYEIDDLKMMGVGTATKNENRSYFVVINSDKLEAIRDRYELPKQDFHITLGFNFKDVFGVRKNQVLEKEGKFLQLLKQEYYKNDNWEFIKTIGNFNLSKDEELIPVDLSDSRVKFKCGDNYTEVGLLDDEKFWIVAQYPIVEEMPRLSETEIAKKLNKK